MPDLFDALAPAAAQPPSGAEAVGPADHVRSRPTAPLAERLRPRDLAEIVGQGHLIGEEGLLTRLLRQDVLPSLILWGPPGTGKTTLARLLAAEAGLAYVEMSAVTSGVADVKAAAEGAGARLRFSSHRTLLFIDELHRFSKTQQDALLPHVESGLLTLIGATTENPSFSVVGALLSRCRVVVLERLDDAAMTVLLERALAELSRQHGRPMALADGVATALVAASDGDGRRLLTSLELAYALWEARPDESVLSLDTVRQALQRKHLRHDRTGEEHYNIISAVHKSLRDSDPDGTLYWVARLLEAGEDPLFVARRLTRAAAEDIGLADPNALTVATSAFLATERLGMPEANVILAEAAVYLALAPKSNAVYAAYNAVKADVDTTSAEPVPLHLRNAPTKLMKGLGYGQGYQYAHDTPDAKVEQQHLPDSLRDRRYYQPIRGWEKDR